MKEVWKDIDSYKGVYQASSLGRIRSLDRKVCDGKNLKGTIISPYINSGYLRLSLRENGDFKNFYVHRLVATTFIDNPKNKPQVNHKDGNKLNNCIDNLEWTTASENIIHAHKSGLTNPATKPVVQLTKDGGFIKEFLSSRAAEVETKTSFRHISRCCLGGRKSANGFLWLFLEDYDPKQIYFRSGKILNEMAK